MSSAVFLSLKYSSISYIRKGNKNLGGNYIIKFDIKGFTLVETMIVIAIIVILATIAVPAFVDYIEYTKEKVCAANRAQVKRAYELDLIIENTEHSEDVFEQYLQTYGEICPSGGAIYTNNDGNVRCLVHSKDDGSGGNDEGNGGDDGTVPFL